MKRPTVKKKIPYYPTFKASLEAQGQSLPLYLQQEFEDFLVEGTPAKRGKKTKEPTPAETEWIDKTPEAYRLLLSPLTYIHVGKKRHRAMTWMQGLKRVFDIDIETCERCGVHVKVIASIDKSAG